MNRWTLITIAAIGCGGASAPPESAEPTPYETCVAFFTRQRECANEYVPELVELRVRFDRPEGTQERDQREGREALVSAAFADYASSSTDQSIRSRCEHIANEPDAREAADNFATCISREDCRGFVPCDLSLLVQHWAAE